MKGELVFQFASPATTINLLNDLSFYEITDDVSREKLANFWLSNDIDTVKKLWFESHDKASQLTMSGFKMDKMLSSILYESFKITKIDF